MSEMVERVARAIYGAGGPNDSGPLGDLVYRSIEIDAQDPCPGESEEIAMRICRQAARAAIEAMRDPTSAIIAGMNLTYNSEAREAWRDGIDAALVSERKP